MRSAFLRGVRILSVQEDPTDCAALFVSAGPRGTYSATEPAATQ